MKKKIFVAVMLVVVALCTILVGCVDETNKDSQIKYENPKEFWEALEASTSKICYNYYSGKIDQYVAMDGNVIEYALFDGYDEACYHLFIEQVDSKFNVYECFDEGGWIANKYNSIQEMLVEEERKGDFAWYALAGEIGAEDIKSLNDLFNYGYYFIGYHGHEFEPDFDIDEDNKNWYLTPCEGGWYHGYHSFKITSSNELLVSPYLGYSSDHEECVNWNKETEIGAYSKYLIGCDRKIEIPQDATNALK